MTDVFGRTIAVGDFAPGGKITEFVGSDSVRVVYPPGGPTPIGYVAVAAKIPTLPSTQPPGSGWWTCFPQKCEW